MDTQEVKETVIASVTSALSARQTDDMDERLNQFGKDFIMIMDGIDGHDLFRVSSLLADFSAFLVCQMAEQLGTEADSLMHYLATQMLNVPIKEHGDD